MIVRNEEIENQIFEEYDGMKVLEMIDHEEIVDLIYEDFDDMKIIEKIDSIDQIIDR